jgi:hypothetical protein
VSYADEVAARLARDREWNERYAEHRRPDGLPPPHHAPGYAAGEGGKLPVPPGRCTCGCMGDSAPYPDGLGGGDAGTGTNGSPARSLMWLLANRHAPPDDDRMVAARAEARGIEGLRQEETDEIAGIGRCLTGREALDALDARRSPDGSNLSGTAAREWVRRTEFRAEWKTDGTSQARIRP